MRIGGAALRELGRSTEAMAALKSALTLNPYHVGALGSRAAVLLDQGRAEAALESAALALSLDPIDIVALYNFASALRALGRTREAIAACESALRVKPAHVELLSQYAALLRKAGRTREALKALDLSLQIRPNDTALLVNRGHVLGELGQHSAAAASYRAAYVLNPAMPYLPGWRLHAQLRVSDWKDLDKLRVEVADGIDAGRVVCEPFVALFASLDRKRLRRCAEQHVLNTWVLPSRRVSGAVSADCGRTQQGANTGCTAALRKNGPERLRLGYFSADFHEHPTAQLLAGRDRTA